MEILVHMNNNEPTPLEAAIAKQIVVELAERDMTRRQLAEALGIEEATMSRYLNGKRSMPMTTFFKVADVFGLDQVELLRRSKARLGD